MCSFETEIYTGIERNSGCPCSPWMPLSYGLLPGSPFLTEEVAQDSASTFAVEAGDDFNLMIEALVLDDVVER